MVLELGQCETDFSIVWPTGERVPFDKITPGHLPVARRTRIQKRTGSGRADWFRFDQSQTEDVFERTAREVLPFFDEVERVFSAFTAS